MPDLQERVALGLTRYEAATSVCLLERSELATALELLARERESALARRLAARLGPIFAAGRGETDPLGSVEVLSDPTRIALRSVREIWARRG